MYKVLVTLNVKMLEKSFVTINSTIYQNSTLPTKIQIDPPFSLEQKLNHLPKLFFKRHIKDRNIDTKTRKNKSLKSNQKETKKKRNKKKNQHAIHLKQKGEI